MIQKLKVLELAAVLAGPSVGQFFAELGAEVIKVENLRTNGDVTRTWKVKGENTDDRSSYFCAVNWGKKSIAVDLHSREGREIIYGLAKSSDIVIASYKHGDAKKLQVDFQTLAELNPLLIYGQITGFGSRDSRVGYDAVIQAEAGFMYLNGEPGGPSLKMPVALMDLLAGHQLKEGLLLALLERTYTGKGQLVEVSLLDAAVASLANQASNWLVAGIMPEKQGSAHPNIAPYGEVFRTADNKEVLLAVGTDGQFQALCKILDIGPGTVQRFQTNALRVLNRRSLTDLLSEKIGAQPLTSFQTVLQAENIPYGLIRNMKEVFESDNAANLLLSGDGRTGVKTYVGSNSLTDFSHFLPPPRYGQHTEEVLMQSLEMDLDEVKRLKSSRIIL